MPPSHAWARLDVELHISTMFPNPSHFRTGSLELHPLPSQPLVDPSWTSLPPGAPLQTQQHSFHHNNRISRPYPRRRRARAATAIERARGCLCPPPYSTRCPDLTSFACLVYILSEVEALGLCFPVQDVSSQGLRFPCSNSLASCIVKL
jgi:hypothetical protein